MSEQKRATRPKIERTEPDRGFTGAFREAANGAEQSDAASSPDPESPPGWTETRDASYEAINSGYRVIDEYMRQGQRLAEGFWLPAPDSRGTPPEFTRTMERFLRSAGDMGSAWLEMMTDWTRPSGADMSPRGTAGPFTAGRTNGEAAGTETRSETVNATGFSIAVESSRRVRVSVEASIHLKDVEVYPLTSSDRTLPPITTTAVELDPESGHALLRVAVSDDQPPGTYHGVLLDRRTQRPGGTITLLVE